MSQSTFANGQVLVSSALTPPQVETIFQAVIANILGFQTPPTTNELPNAWSAVRCAWQQDGQPAFEIDADTCVVQATSENEPYSQVRDSLLATNDDVSDTQNMSFTQVWKLALTLYGPNAYDHARLIVTAMSLDWVHDALQLSKIYAVVIWNRPRYVPELYQGRWWQRVDVELQFNELVNESITVPTALSVEVTIDTDSGITETIEIEVPE